MTHHLTDLFGHRNKCVCVCGVCMCMCKAITLHLREYFFFFPGHTFKLLPLPKKKSYFKTRQIDLNVEMFQVPQESD